MVLLSLRASTQRERAACRGNCLKRRLRPSGRRCGGNSGILVPVIEPAASLVGSSQWRRRSATVGGTLSAAVLQIGGHYCFCSYGQDPRFRTKGALALFRLRCSAGGCPSGRIFAASTSHMRTVPLSTQKETGAAAASGLRLLRGGEAPSGRPVVLFSTATPQTLWSEEGHRNQHTGLNQDGPNERFHSPNVNSGTPVEPAQRSAQRA